MHVESLRIYSLILTSFNHHFDGEICPCCYMKFDFIRSHYDVVFYCVDIAQFTHSPVDGYSGCCQLGVRMNSAAVNTLAHAYRCTMNTSLLGKYLWFATVSHKMVYN